MLANALAVMALAAGLASAKPLLPRSTNLHFPNEVTNYNVGTGALTCSTTAIISKDPQNGGQDTTTIYTFVIDSSYAGKQCQIGFSLSGSPGTVVTGSPRMQLFTSLRAPTACAQGGFIGSWAPGNGRDVHVADILLTGTTGGSISPIGSAKYIREPADCPVGQSLVFETVGTGDSTSIIFDPTTEGLFIQTY